MSEDRQETGARVAVDAALSPELSSPAERISQERISALSHKLAPRYELAGKVGNGPESVVYQGKDLTTSEVVAIKIVDLPEDATVAGALAAEAHLASGVDHPRVGKIVAFEFDADDAYFISRFVEGESLHQRVRRDGPLAIDAVKRAGQDVAEAVNAIHALWLLHRNVKSSNVILTPDGSAVLTDLGVGRPTGAPGRLSLAGLPAFTAPEVFEGFADQRSDLFGVGACLYEALTGRPPPMGYLKTPDGLGPDPCEHRKDCPDDLAQVVRECLAREPSKRPASAAELGLRLGRRLAGAGDAAEHTSAWRKLALFLLVLGLVGGAAVILVWRYASWYPDFFGRVLPFLHLK